MDGVIGVHVKRCLGCQRGYGLPDHASNEENHEMDSKLTKHCKEMEGKDRVFWDGEVVEEASEEDESSDGDGRGYKGFGVGCLSQISQAHQENSQPSGEKTQTDEVQLLKLLPACLIVVIARTRWWKVKDHRSNYANAGVDDGDIVTPPPGGMEDQLVRYEYAQAGPWDIDAEFGPSKPNATIHSVSVFLP